MDFNKMNFLSDFDVFEKFSKEDVLENGVSSVKMEYKNYINYYGNYLARKEGVCKSFEVLADKIADGAKSVAIFLDGNRLVIIYNGFWDKHHKSVVYIFEENANSAVQKRKLNKLIEMVKIFSIGYTPKIFFIEGSKENAEVLKEILLQKLSMIKVLQTADIIPLMNECHFVENNIEKSKKVLKAVGIAAISFFIVNIGLAYADNQMSETNKAKIDKIDSSILSIRTQIDEETEKTLDLEKRLNDGKIWCD